MRHDESFGVIPVCRKEGRWEVFLIQHQRSRHWSFPKGHAEANETAEEAAFRELKEETNLELTRYIRAEPFVEMYTFLHNGEKVHKRVHYFLAEVAGVIVLQELEIHKGAWMGLDEAYGRMTHSEGRTILSQAAKILENLV
jgi:8-oxo-dGTP pyrophosphatase MutT (NUDIX family)